MIETKFKNTEIGPIPVDWEVKSIAEVAPLQRGFDLPKSCLTPGDYPVVYSNGIGYYHNQFQCKAPGLVTGRSGTIGKFTLISKGYYWPHNTTLWVTNFNNNNPLYLYYRYSTLSFEDSATGTGVPTLNRNYLKDKKIAMPPLAEQEAIGGALREVDELIEGFKKLVAKKRAIKQGAMSQLLSGKSRLPGFSEPWKEVTFEEMGETFGGLSGKTKSDFNIGTAKYITFLNVIRNIKIQPNLFEAVSVGANEKQNKVLKGDLLFNTSSETPEEVALCSVLTQDIDNLYLNSFCFGFRLKRKDVLPLFIAYLLRTSEGRNLMSKTAAGVTRFNVSKKKFLSTSIYLPTLAEQEAIAKVLTDMDAEIEALSRKVAKYEQVKQGMMQQLLTGKIRLVQHPHCMINCMISKS